MSRTGSRKRSYRPVQYALVVTAFLASFMGTVWLQHQDAAAEAAISDAPPAELVVVPTAPAVATDAAVAEVPAAAEVEQGEVEFEEESDEEDESVIVALPTPTATVPSMPTVQRSAPSAQLAARQSAPRAVARSRSSR